MKQGNTGKLLFVYLFVRGNRSYVSLKIIDKHDVIAKHYLRILIGSRNNKKVAREKIGIYRYIHLCNSNANYRITGRYTA